MPHPSAHGNFSGTLLGKCCSLYCKLQSPPWESIFYQPFPSKEVSSYHIKNPDVLESNRLFQFHLCIYKPCNGDTSPTFQSLNFNVCDRKVIKSTSQSHQKTTNEATILNAQWCAGFLAGIFIKRSWFPPLPPKQERLWGSISPLAPGGKGGSERRVREQRGDGEGRAGWLHWCHPLTPPHCPASPTTASPLTGMRDETAMCQTESTNSTHPTQKPGQAAWSR